MLKESWLFTADKLNDYLRNPKSRPEFGDPNHPDYEVNKRFLDALETAFHNKNTDQLFPWFAKQYMNGDLKHVPERHQDPRHEFMMAKDPDAIAAEAHEYAQQLRNAGYTEEQIQREMIRYGPTAWNRLDPQQVDKIGEWLGNTNSQHPTRKDFDIQGSTWEEMKDRAEDYATWKRMRESLKKAVYKSEDGKYHIYPLAPEDCQWEGEQMSNCIRGHGYEEKIRNGQALIYSVRNKAGVPKVDVEIKPTVAYNPKTKESMPIEDYRRAKGGGRNRTCPTCNGNGAETDENGQFRRDPETNHIIRCAQCEGRGVIREEPEANPEIENFSPSPVNGTIVQIQGKQNRPPIARYHQPLKEFFTKKFPDQMRPQWDPNITGHYENFANVYRPGDMIMYHPGDYGLERPNITNDWMGNPQDRTYHPGLVYSFANSSRQDDEHDKKGARHLYHWAHDLGEMDQLEAALQDEGLMNALKAQAGQNFNVRETPEYQQWTDRNPQPRNEVQEPQLIDEQGNDRYGTPEYQAEEQAFREANERYWLERERWDDQHRQIQEQLKAGAGERFWPQTRQAQMLNWLHGFVSGNPPQIYDPEEEQDDAEAQAVPHQGKLLEPWCICGKCHAAWSMVRTADQKSEQAWRKVRNQLRKNNILTPENEAGWGNLSKVYADHGHLAEWLHREFRKGRLKSNGNFQYYMRDITNTQAAIAQNEQAMELAKAKGDDAQVRTYEATIAAYQQQIERLKTQIERSYEQPMTVADVPTSFHVETNVLTPELMDAMSAHIKKENQRDKDFNVMKQELPPLFLATQKKEQERRLMDASGVPIHQLPNGWSIRYINDPESAKLEGELMGHCIGSYGDRINMGTSVNHTLRDPEGFPHATWDYRSIQNKPFVNWDALAAQGKESPNMPGYCQSCGSDMRHMPRLCPNCEGPLTAKGLCTRCGYEGGSSCSVCTRRMKKMRDEFEGLDGYDSLSSGHRTSAELREMLNQGRNQGHVIPDVSRAHLGQLQIKGGGYGTNRLKPEYKDMIRQWVDATWPDRQDRPVSPEGRYAQEIYHPDQIPNDDDQPVDDLGLRTGERTLSLTQAINHMREPRIQGDIPDYVNPDTKAPYDPARGQKVYDYAVKHNQTAGLYQALNNWQANPQPGTTKPICPGCRYSDDVSYNGQGWWRCRYCHRDFEAQAPDKPKPTGPQYTPYQAAAVQHLAPMLAQHPELVEQATWPECPACRRPNTIVPYGPYGGEEDTKWCNWCGTRFDRNMQRLGYHNMDPRPHKHIGPNGNICWCGWHDPTQLRWAASQDSDWGEDSDSGQAIQPDHYPRDEIPTTLVDRHGDPIPCETCGDPLSDGYCKRCDWGGWIDGDPLKRFPEDAPIRDMKPAIQY